MNEEDKRKKIVVIGGGNGSAKTIRACKTFIDKISLSSVVSVSDSGGSSGRLRREFNTLPAGDILRAVLAMSRHDYKILKRIFYKIRFNEAGKLDGHDLGNLFLILSEQYGGDFVKSIRALEQSVEAHGKVYPVTLDNVNLFVELQNGGIVKTEENIDRPDYDFSIKIKKAWLEPEGEIYGGAKKAIEEAEYILLGPGSLYCSVIAALLPNGVRQSIEKSLAKIIFITGNAYEQIGETGPDKLSGFVKRLQSYLPRKIDFVVYNDYKLDDLHKRWYEEKKWGLFEPDFENLPDYEIVKCDYEDEEYPGLNQEKLGAILKSIILKD